MRVGLVLVFLVVISCQNTEFECDTAVHEMYPTEGVMVLTETKEPRIYIVGEGDGIAVSCYSAMFGVGLKATPIVPWKKAMCSTWGNFTQEDAANREKYKCDDEGDKQ